jgi:hypothetical protein
VSAPITQFECYRSNKDCDNLSLHSYALMSSIVFMLRYQCSSILGRWMNKSWSYYINVNVPISKHHTLKVYRGVEVKLHALVTSTLHRCAWTSSHSGQFTPWEIATIPVGQDTGWAPESVWTGCPREKSDLLWGALNLGRLDCAQLLY